MADKQSDDLRSHKPSFRSAMNTRYTRQLFRDQQQSLANTERLIEPMYTLMHDYPGLVNFRRVYVQLADPTGYKLSQLYLEDYDHWTLLMKASWFREAKEAWDKELDAKLASEGLSTIRMFSDGIEGVAPALQLQAAKYLANLEHKKVPKEASKRGRPTKEEVAGELKTQTQEAATFADDAARIRLVKS